MATPTIEERLSELEKQMSRLLSDEKKVENPASWWEQWFSAAETKNTSAPRSLAPLVGKYEGESWDELLTEIEKNRPQESQR